VRHRAQPPLQLIEAHRSFEQPIDHHRPPFANEEVERDLGRAVFRVFILGVMH
jgi:hypothetical protein